jgi:endonuclease/exonuclease/phosphatase family metal-dependent hydrolase
VQRSAPFELTVATLNLWGLNSPCDYMERRGEVRGAVPGSAAVNLRLPEGSWPARRRELAARALADSSASIIGLQEDHQNLDPAVGGSQSEQLAADLGYAVAQIPGALEEGTVKGNAVLSRYPIVRVTRAPLPPGDGEAEQFGAGVRDALHALIETPRGVVHFFVVHLTTRGRDAQIAEAKHLLKHVAACGTDGTSSVAIVVGDFNATPDSSTIGVMTSGRTSGDAYLHDVWAEANPNDPGYTMPIHTPRTADASHMRIDYLFVGSGPTIMSSRLLGTEPDADGFYASDHFGVATTLRW